MDQNKHDSISNLDHPEYDEEIEEDLYLLALQKKLANMKKERKKAEQDANLLKNRLNLLKGEEDKTWKKVETTKKKTQDKLLSMQKFEDQLMLKNSLKEKREKEIELQKEINLKLKNEIKNNIVNKREEKLRQMKEEAVVVKEQKKVRNNLCFIKFINILYGLILIIFFALKE